MKRLVKHVLCLIMQRNGMKTYENHVKSVCKTAEQYPSYIVKCEKTHKVQKSMCSMFLLVF